MNKFEILIALDQEKSFAFVFEHVPERFGKCAVAC